MVGITIISLGIVMVIVEVYRDKDLPPFVYLITLSFFPPLVRIFIGALLGIGLIMVSILELNRSILAPFMSQRRGALIDAMYSHSFKQRGNKIVALGGGTGLPAVLRGLKSETSNITPIGKLPDHLGTSETLPRDF